MAHLLIGQSVDLYECFGGASAPVKYGIKCATSDGQGGGRLALAFTGDVP